MSSGPSFRSLRPDEFTEVFRTFEEAFADYRVDTGLSSEQDLRDRAIKDGLDFNASVGAFRRGKMVGFTLVGLDRWEGEPAAFDIATGIIPEDRGKGIAAAMLEFIRPHLRNLGVKRFVLNVLRPNKAAISAYRTAGFRISRDFECFALATSHLGKEHEHIPGFEISEAELSALDPFSEALDWVPSWDYTFSSIQRVPDPLRIRLAHVEGLPAGLLVYHPASQRVFSLVVQSGLRRRGIATRLFDDLCTDIRQRTSTVKFVNVDAEDSGMLAFLGGRAARPLVGQHEMILEL
jgi:ribosomal protein S18 acetylase RimI-like enzyme